MGYFDMSGNCDPALAIRWPVSPAEAIVTAKDAALPLLADAPSRF